MTMLPEDPFAIPVVLQPCAGSCGTDVPVPMTYCDNCFAVLCQEAQADSAAARALEHAERAETRYRALLRDSMMPSMLRADRHGLDDLDRPQRADALDAASRFARGELRCLVITGPVGVGKSTIAAAAAKAYMKTTGKPLRWLRVHEVTTRLSLPFDDLRRAETIDALSSTAALVLDDLDKTRPTAYAAEPLFSAIDATLSDGRPLLVTTNLSLPEIAGKWPAPTGQAIASRLAEHTVIEIRGSDRRVAA